jgi:hypothetical protein
MTVPLYMDHHVHAAITQGLRNRGVDVLTAFEDGTATWDDEQILDRATQTGRVLFTQDDDFLVIADQWQQDGREFAGVVYAWPLGITIGQAIADLELIAKVFDPDDMRNRIEYIPYS